MKPDQSKSLWPVLLASRLSLALVWIYEGLVPKILFLGAHPAQIDLVRRSGIFWPSPEVTLIVLGAAQALLGTLLLLGWRQRALSLLATLWMVVLMFLVARGLPGMLSDPFGALAKDLCLAACAFNVWLLAPRGMPSTAGPTALRQAA